MNPPANWYPDPTGRHGQRYWDGAQWTEHVFTDGVQGVDPLETAEEDEDVGDATVTTGTELAPEADVHDEVDAEAHAEAQDEAQDEAAVVDADEGAQPDDEPAPVAATTAPVSETAQEAETDVWRPRDQQDDVDDTVGTEQAPDDDALAVEAAVAPELDADDVVANLDEVQDGETPAEPDFSDAFVLAPETASRLVRRDEPVEAQDATDQDEAPTTSEQPAGAIDAPPPSMPAPAATEPPATTGASPASDATVPAATGITGSLLSGAFAEDEDAGPVALQNARLLRCSLDGQRAVVARQGTMVAYQGDVGFERQGAGGLGKALKRAATGEGMAMMRVGGTGDVFFADTAQHVFLLELGGGAGLSVNGRNVLAFDAALDWDIERVKGASLLAGGLFNTTLAGTGWVALVSDGEPVVLRTDDAPTFVDVNALVAWSGGLQTRIVNTVSAKSLVGLGSGEAFQMAFEGNGVVIVQPSEGAAASAAAG